MSKSMLLITSTWGKNKTFKMIPASVDAPYVECIFDIDSSVLVVIGKEKKESFHMVPKLTDMGDLQALKIGKRPNGKDYAEERKLLNTYYEYYIENKEEIINFINAFALNSDSFDFTQYVEKTIYEKPTTPESQIITMA